MADIDASIEHIVPHALGGGADFSVQAERRLNNSATGLDQALAQAPLIGLMRVTLGIETYHGCPKITLPGKVQGHDVPIKVVFTEAGATSRVTDPVKMDPSGDSGTIIVPADQEDAFVEQLIAGHARKGRQVVVERATSLGSAVTLDFGFDFMQIKRATAKIAFLAAFRVLGDEFLDDPLYDEWHQCIFSDDPDRLARSTLRGNAFDGSGLLDMTAPKVQRHEHVAVVANVGMQGPIVMVGLFGGELHNIAIPASQTSCYGLRETEGEIVIVDATTRTSRVIDFQDFLIARSRSEM